MRKQKTAIITDLDNTLFDWVDLWVKCFSSMLEGIVEISGVPKEQLIPEIRKIHQKHGTSEYSFLIEEIPSLQSILKGKTATEVFATPIANYQRARRKNLRLYATVAETLLRIKGRGVRIIGYTESMAFYSNYRVRRLGLDGVLDHIFCPEDHILPEGLSSEDVRKYPTGHYELGYSKQHYTPKGSTKPDTGVLNSIVNHLGLTLTPKSGPGGSSPMRPERWSYPSWPVPASGSRCSSGAVVGYRRSRCTRIAQPWPRAG